MALSNRITYLFICYVNTSISMHSGVVRTDQVGTQRENDVVSTSMRRDLVASTLIRRHFDVVCLLGNYFYALSGKKILKTMPRIPSKIGAPRGSKLFPFRGAPMVKKQSILCKRHCIINIFLTQVMHMRNVRNERYVCVSWS